MLKDEINFIKNSVIKEDAEFLVSKLPDYFFKVAASSTGKYHPKFSLDEGGLLRHTKAAVRIAKELLSLEGSKYQSDDKDIIILALILHDGFKHGYTYSTYTKAEHPALMADFIRNQELKMSKELQSKLANCIETHMGEWNSDYKTKKELMPKPSTSMQNFVHICDYLASRKFLNINFVNNEIVEG